MNTRALFSATAAALLIIATGSGADRTLLVQEEGFTPLFAEEGVPKGWTVRQWNDLAKPPDEGVQWQVKDGVLHGSQQRGTWLVSEQEYGDFVLEFEWKLEEEGNSGCALRAPMRGDPAFDGLELQMVDPKYNPPTATPAEFTGGLYKAVAPREQRYAGAGQWNKYRITCRGSLVKVELNGGTVLDLDLETSDAKPKRHNGSEAPLLKDRPRRGHIGFQELSRSGHVQIRNARIKTLD